MGGSTNVTEEGWYVDTSVLAAYYCPERGSEAAQAALLSVSRPTVSWLAEVELASALSRKVRTGDLRRPDAARILSLFESHLETGAFQRVSMERQDFQAARRWLSAMTTSLRTLDALHLAVAARAGLALLTADAQLAAAAHRFGIACREVVA